MNFNNLLNFFPIYKLIKFGKYIHYKNMVDIYYEKW